MKPPPVVRVAVPPDRPVVVFDGDCTFCRFWIERWKSISRGRLDYAPYQETAARFPEIPEDEFRRAVQLVSPSGEVFSGAEAVVRALAEVPGRGHWLAMYRGIPGARAATDAAYRLIADHRDAAFRVTRLFWGTVAEKPTYFRASSLFVRLLALCYLAAFLSLSLQVDGLIGPRGILPAEGYLDWIRAQTGPSRFWWVPTFAWLSAKPAMLYGLCAGGVLASVVVFFGFAPTLGLALAWASYLSLSSISQVFLNYQWDALLLETGLLAIFLSPPVWRLRFSASSPPSPSALLLLRWLLFRLVFSSGAVKLGSGDPAWRSLTALRMHYETQPLPTWIGWAFHQFPPSFQTVSCVFLFFVELVVPFLVFAPRRAKHLAFGLLVFLQILIALTGNYAFFNWLAIALCVLLLDDTSLPSRRGRRTPAPPAPVRPRRWPVGVIAPVAAVLLIASALQLVFTVRRTATGVPNAAVRLVSWLSPLRSVNRYGLFAVMTTRRPEIIVEGSDDGRAWRPYEFRWKPGAVDRPPRFVAPHQPRLDWQMWFAALESCEENPWLVNFLGRLLQGEPAVLRLLATNPFPAGPPRYVRTLVYDYRFTDWPTRRRTGAWWRRELQGPYCPIVSRDMLRETPGETPARESRQY
ncbi:MAG TPA: lipase maturation factor family protein [Thermoanaerobaculia bacterium]|jgi:predicted DCC family thiol-disulfide oxidoreductase YuxK